MNQSRTLRNQESCKNCQKKESVKNIRILLEGSDLIYKARTLCRRNGKRILTDNQQNQECGKTGGKIVN